MNMNLLAGIVVVAFEARARHQESELVAGRQEHRLSHQHGGRCQSPPAGSLSRCALRSVVSLAVVVAGR